MRPRIALAAMVLLGASPLAIAQTTASPGTNSPGTTSPGANSPGTTAPNAGTSSAVTSGTMTEGQIKQKLNKQGYSNVRLKRVAGTSGGPTAGSGSMSDGGAGTPAWTGTASKRGKRVSLEIDATGEVTER
jgi:hypothetical protein